MSNQTSAFRHSCRLYTSLNQISDDTIFTQYRILPTCCGCNMSNASFYTMVYYILLFVCLVGTIVYGFFLIEVVDDAASTQMYMYVLMNLIVMEWIYIMIQGDRWKEHYRIEQNSIVRGEIRAFYHQRQ